MAANRRTRGAIRRRGRSYQVIVYAYDVGRHALTLLLQRLDGRVDGEPRRETLNSRLITRESVTPLTCSASDGAIAHAVSTSSSRSDR